MFASSPPPLSAVTLPNGYQYQSLSPSPSLVHSESDTSLDWSNTDPHLSHRGPSRPTYALQGQPLSAKGQYWTDRSEPYESVQVAQRYQQEQGYGPLTPAYTVIADPESIPITLQEYDGREYGEYEQLRVMDSATMGSAFERPTYTAVGGQSVSMTSEGDSIGVSQQLPTWSWMPLNGSLRAFPGGQEQILGSVSSDMSYLKYPESDLRSSNEQGQMQSIRDTRPTVGERRRSRQNGQTRELTGDVRREERGRLAELLTGTVIDQSNPIKLERTITETCEDALYIPALSSQSASRSNFAPTTENDPRASHATGPSLANPASFTRQQSVTLGTSTELQSCGHCSSKCSSCTRQFSHERSFNRQHALVSIWPNRQFRHAAYPFFQRDFTSLRSRQRSRTITFESEFRLSSRPPTPAVSLQSSTVTDTQVCRYRSAFCLPAGDPLRRDQWCRSRSRR